MYNNLNAKPLCKLLLLTFCAISTISVFSQTNWSESFSDSNFTHAPIWEGDTASFLVSHTKELQLNAAAVSSSKLMFTNSQTIWEASWEFRVKYDFNPSTNNYSKVYFASQAGLQNGYYVELGGNSQDRISLRKLENGNSTTLIQSSDDWLNTGKIDIQIKVERDQNGEFSLFADTSGFYVNIGTVADSTFYTSSVFAWECIYTSTRSDKFHFDDIVVSGKTFQDSIPPRVTHAKFLDSNSIELTFSEPIDTNSFSDLASFVLAPNGTNPNAVYASGFKSIRLDFTTPFSNRTQHSLWVEDIEDLFGNSVQDTAIDLFYFTPAWGDVILSEIMFDPSPIVQLPDQEYLELFNRSSYPINLDGWKLSNGNSSIGLFSFVLQPNDYFTDYRRFNVECFLTFNLVWE